MYSSHLAVVAPLFGVHQLTRVSVVFRAQSIILNTRLGVIIISSNHVRSSHGMRVERLDSSVQILLFVVAFNAVHIGRRSTHNLSWMIADLVPHFIATLQIKEKYFYRL